jgi:glycosyltransferase involved in cell wall biosynthesis
MTMLVQPVSNSPEWAQEGNSSEAPLISVVVPVYKEETNIRPFLERAVPVLEGLGPYEILFCLDPSPDQTESVVLAEIERNPRIGLLVFSRRFGQPAATMAGILNCRGQWCVVIDVDLQDPPELIAKLLKKGEEGFDVVLGRRSRREGETLVKTIVSEIGYKMINEVADVTIPRNTGDFRIMSRRIIEELRALNESHGFLRGLVSLVGFPQTEIEYERDARHAGIGNYNRYLGSLKIGFNGLFGFSTFPLQFMMWTGFTIAMLSVVAILCVIALKIVQGDAIPVGVPTIIILVLFMGGIQLTGIGVLGEYVGRTYEEVRRRPMYIVARAVNVAVRDRRGPGTGHGVAAPRMPQQ